MARGRKILLSDACARADKSGVGFGPDREGFGPELINRGSWKGPPIGPSSATDLLIFDKDDMPNAADALMDAIYGKNTRPYRAR